MRMLIRRKPGFTLIELMFVIMLIGILLAIAIPAFTQARDKARTKSCMKNLSHIQTAKEQYEIVAKKSDGDTVVFADLVPYYIKAIPECPEDGAYDLMLLGQNPTCTVEGHQLSP